MTEEQKAIDYEQPPIGSTVDEFVQYIQGAVAKVGKKIPPDGDWVPVLFTSSLKGFNIRALVGFNTSEFRKEITAMITIPKMIKDDNAQMAAYLSTAWFTMLEEDVRYKEECIVVQIVSPSREVTLLGTIEREDRKPPRISKWEVNEAGKEGYTFEGRYVEGLRLGIRGTTKG